MVYSGKQETREWKIILNLVWLAKNTITELHNLNLSYGTFGKTGE